MKQEKKNNLNMLSSFYSFWLNLTCNYSYASQKTLLLDFFWK